MAAAPETDDLLAILPPVLKLFRCNKLLHYQMLRCRLQVLSKGQDVNACLFEVHHRVDDLQAAVDSESISDTLLFPCCLRNCTPVCQM